MLDFSVIFNTVTGALDYRTRDGAHTLSAQFVGTGASVNVLAARPVTSQKPSAVPQFGAQSEVFEGALVSSQQAEWSVHDVFSVDFGILLENSNLIEGFRAFVQHQDGLNAAVVGEVVDGGLGYATGGFVDALVDGVSGTSVDLGVMSS
ncbi:hypothetical protein [Enhygromyxa salina]|uniref:hypothetical protein n=1 Tax=Enhygromyxa salina TaxID=215803 RepID=UPI0013FD0816|nr:hypothetical protein [Enhygromyxa salina]